METTATSISERHVLNGFLGQQLGVLSRIDLDMRHYGSTVPTLGFLSRRRARLEAERDANRLVALDMSKRIAAGLRLLWMYLEQNHPMAWYNSERLTRSVLRRELEAIVDTPFDHPYAISAMWNFHAIIAHLAAFEDGVDSTEDILSASEAPR